MMQTQDPTEPSPNSQLPHGPHSSSVVHGAKGTQLECEHGLQNPMSHEQTFLVELHWTKLRLPEQSKKVHGSVPRVQLEPVPVQKISEPSAQVLSIRHEVWGTWPAPRVVGCSVALGVGAVDGVPSAVRVSWSAVRARTVTASTSRPAVAKAERSRILMSILLETRFPASLDPPSDTSLESREQRVNVSILTKFSRNR